MLKYENIDVTNVWDLVFSRNGFGWIGLNPCSHRVFWWIKLYAFDQQPKSYRSTVAGLPACWFRISMFLADKKGNDLSCIRLLNCITDWLIDWLIVCLFVWWRFRKVDGVRLPSNVTVRMTSSSASVAWYPAYNNGQIQRYTLWLILYHDVISLTQRGVQPWQIQPQISVELHVNFALTACNRGISKIGRYFDFVGFSWVSEFFFNA